MLPLYVLIIVMMILIAISAEQFIDPKNKAYIRLYSDFNQNNLQFQFTPRDQFYRNRYIRLIVKINLKSLDINMPLLHDGLDDVRVLEIWNMYEGTNVSSLESDFYNSYTEPDYARRANPGKYKLLLRLHAGQHYKLNITEPVKKIFLYARM